MFPDTNFWICEICVQLPPSSGNLDALSEGTKYSFLGRCHSLPDISKRSSEEVRQSILTSTKERSFRQYLPPHLKVIVKKKTTSGFHHSKVMVDQPGKFVQCTSPVKKKRACVVLVPQVLAKQGMSPASSARKLIQTPSFCVSFRNVKRK
jgi:hypothetical protein